MTTPVNAGMSGVMSSVVPVQAGFLTARLGARFVMENPIINNNPLWFMLIGYEKGMPKT
jgi:hypothetical protein